MLTVDVEKRISIDECLEHPWTTQNTGAPSLGVNDSTDGLTGALSQLDFTRRKPHRERTLLSSINNVKVDRVMETHPDAPPVKVFDKNQGPQFVLQKKQNGEKVKAPAKEGKVEKTMVEPTPADGRDPAEFVEMGGKGDELLYPGGGESRYPENEELRASAPGEEGEGGK